VSATSVIKAIQPGKYPVQDGEITAEGQGTLWADGIGGLGRTGRKPQGLAGWLFAVCGQIGLGQARCWTWKRAAALSTFTAIVNVGIDRTACCCCQFLDGYVR
jgi:hypothetical protein